MTGCPILFRYGMSEWPFLLLLFIEEQPASWHMIFHFFRVPISRYKRSATVTSWNFGGFATPERTLIFDANDFDEKLPASWEWDIKRLATSFVLAARHNHLRSTDAKEMAFILTQSYRRHIIDFARMNLLDLWYMKFYVQAIRESRKA